MAAVGQLAVVMISAIRFNMQRDTGMWRFPVGYRFAPQDPFPAQVEDVKCAVRWLRAHAADLKLDGDEWVRLDSPQVPISP